MIPSAVKALSLEDLSLEELKRLRNEITRAMDKEHRRQRRDALASVEMKAMEMGFRLSDLIGNPVKKAKPVSMPKYRHPEDPSLTWTGHGRPPGWIKKAAAAGMKMDDLRIER